MQHDIIIVGAGRRAIAWLEFARRTPHLNVVALVARRPLELAVQQYGTLDEARTAFPNALVMVALPPRAARNAALALSRGLVTAPLSGRLDQLDAGLPVEHGWVTLTGARWLATQLADETQARISISVRGMPARADVETSDALWHALALARSLAPDLSVEGGGAAPSGAFELRLSSARGGSVRLEVRGQGHGLDVSVDAGSLSVNWSWSGGIETLRGRTGRGRVESSRPALGADERVFRQLIEPGFGGDTIAEAREVERLHSAAVAASSRPTIRRRDLAHSARLRAASAPLESTLGFDGPLSRALPAAGALPLVLPPEMNELWAFRAGLKPVAFLTVRPEDEAKALAPFGEVHAERLERRVHVGAQDAWIDDRVSGEPRVELYVSRDPALSKEAVRVQALGDPSAGLRDMGRLMGYPPCCVEAFATQEDRANNTWNRYGTFARTRSGGPWAWELANLFCMLVPFYPCRYDCPAALHWARRVVAEMDRAHPGVAQGLQRSLARPVLYFDHDRQCSLDAVPAGEGRWDVSSVFVPPGTSSDFALFAGQFAHARLGIDDDALTLERDGQLTRLARTEPGLGFIAPFGTSA